VIIFHSVRARGKFVTGLVDCVVDCVTGDLYLYIIMAVLVTLLVVGLILIAVIVCKVRRRKPQSTPPRFEFHADAY